MSVTFLCLKERFEVLVRHVACFYVKKKFLVTLQLMFNVKGRAESDVK